MNKRGGIDEKNRLLVFLFYFIRQSRHGSNTIVKIHCVYSYVYVNFLVNIVLYCLRTTHDGNGNIPHSTDE